ncbi:MAG: TetR/AcrR family transcriptional regulator [Bacilli bacterium]
MPPKPKTKEEVAYERKIILDNALDIITRKGINDLSMRTLAKRCNYSATKLYYYFECKGEIILALIEEGFKELNLFIERTVKDISDPKEKFVTTLDAVYTFSINMDYYYNIMFGVNVPRLTDYIETPNKIFINKHLETEETNEKTFYRVFGEITNNYAKKDELFALNIVSQLAGIALFRSSEVLYKFNLEDSKMYDVTKESIIKLIEK